MPGIFNKEQEEAITHKGGPLMVLAGPGSGINQKKNHYENESKQNNSFSIDRWGVHEWGFRTESLYAG